MTRQEILTALRNGEFDALLGVAETIDLEFKGEPYQVVDRDSEKFELAKDVSALANAVGGVIVIGVRTERDNESAVDVSRALRPLARGLVDEQRYEGILGGMVYPTLRGVSVQFHPSADDENRGLVSIDVPPQNEIDKYFGVQTKYRQPSSVRTCAT